MVPLVLLLDVLSLLTFVALLLLSTASLTLELVYDLLVNQIFGQLDPVLIAVETDVVVVELLVLLLVFDFLQTDPVG